MEDWGAALYGDPCRECGFDWSIDAPDAVALVAAIPARYAAVLDGKDGYARHDDLGWTAGGYVAHVGDNLRIWAERLAGAALHGERGVPGYDQDLLGRARGYDQVPVGGAMWSLRKAVEAWIEAVALGEQHGVVLVHAKRGEQTVPDVVRNNAHDAVHHEWDITRTVGAPTP